MSKTQQWVMGTVVVLLVIVGFVANGLFIKTSGELKNAQTEIAKLKTQTTVEPAPDDSPSEKNMLARVADLLPEGANITHTLALDNGLSLVGTVPSFDQGTEEKSLTLWLTDTQNNKMTELGGTDISAPGASIEFIKHEYTNLAQIHVLNQWEGYDERTSQYVSGKDGSLLLTERWHQGQSIELTRRDKTLKLQFAPADGCKNVSNDNTKVNITGLLANGVEVRFKKSYPITCAFSELVGMGYYPNLEEVQFDGQGTAQNENFAYLRTALGTVGATIDVDRMNAGGVKVTE